MDLFAGIGGFSLAAHWAGYTTIAAVENEDYARRVFQKRFSGVPIYGDIREFDASGYRGTDLITAGMPCQPFSAAGQQKGVSDDRYLWQSVFEVIKQAQPRFFIIENVVGFIEMALDSVRVDMASEEYAAGVFVLPAISVNAWHRRDRVFAVFKRTADLANSAGERCEGFAEKRSGISVFDGTSQNLADAVSLNGKGFIDQKSDKKERPQQSERQARPCGDVYRWWSVEPRIRRVSNGVPNRIHRLRTLGNAVVPQLAYEVIKALESDQ